MIRPLMNPPLPAQIDPYLRKILLQSQILGVGPSYPNPDPYLAALERNSRILTAAGLTAADPARIPNRTCCHVGV